jgi:hypothetical protein
MLGMNREQLEQAVHDWYANNQDKVNLFIQDFGIQSDCGDDVLELVSGVMASVGSTVAMSAIKDILIQNNELLDLQIHELIDAKIAAAIKNQE